jgi:beta-N-acetylhexosaminidase
MALWRRVLCGMLLVGMLLPLAGSPAAAQDSITKLEANQSVDDAWLDAALARMTTADKIGQLFLVTVQGNDTARDSDIARLIQVYRIGGLILAPENGNYTNDDDTPQQLLSLTTALQTLAFTESLPVETIITVPVTSAVPLTATAVPGPPITQTAIVTLPATMTATQLITFPAQGVPLLLAIQQDGDGYPFSDLRTGFTDLPSNMAVGATWKDNSAETTGWIVGHELSAVGVNLLLGPSLDVLTSPRLGLSGDLGTRVFGGDPYWVGRMGSAYIRGVHNGSAGRIATVGKHLPGLGASDRSLDEEISTVDRSLENLRSVELQPFFAVTQGASVTDTVDALMAAHIRYRGFQGNIRYVTRPISLDAQGMQQILSQPEIAPWRANGGVLISDSLGVLAVRRYYSPKLDSFPHRQIAMDAFQAGNDLLTLSHFALSDAWPDQMANIVDTVLFFRERYEADEAFRARVDQSVRRVLLLKRRVAPAWTLTGSVSGPDQLAGVGRSRGAAAQIAQNAMTLLYPPAEELALRLSRPPRFDENIVILSDDRQVRECPVCPPFYLLAPNLIRDTILRMYGPGATAQIDPDRVKCFTYSQLRALMNGKGGTEDLSAAIDDADWILFAILDYSVDENSGVNTLKDYLKEQTAGLEAKTVIVLAYGPPYYLDVTEVSKLTAYYGVYGKTPPFIDASVQAIFQEFVPSGQSPVTVEGVGYDLSEQLRPDPLQVISVLLDAPAADGGTPQPPKLEIGDPLPVRTGVITDHNGHPVPDGTPVTFHAAYVEQGGLGRNIESTTIDGVASAVVTL